MSGVAQRVDVVEDMHGGGGFAARGAGHNRLGLHMARRPCDLDRHI